MYLLDTNIPSNYEDFYDKLLDDYKEYLNKIGVNTNRCKSKYEDSLKCFLRNENLSRESVEVCLKEGYYSAKTIKNCRKVDNKVSYIFTKRLIDWLVYEEYVDLIKGGYDNSVWVYDKTEKKNVREDFFHKSYVVFTDKWFKLKQEFVEGDEIIPLDDVIIIKNKHKNRITYNLSMRLREKRDYLRDLNSFNAKDTLIVEGQRYPLQSYKIFNNSSEKIGGKTYTHCGYQNLKKEKRMKSLINGNPTIALDYPSLEASVMYTLMGEYMDMLDPYYIGLDGFEPCVERLLLKKCFLVMMNSSSKLQAIAAIKNWLETDINQERLYKEGDIPSKNLSAKMMVDSLERRHDKIKEYFYSGKNEDFNIQNITAEINDYVVGYLFGEKNIMVGQVHDCFIVEVEHKDILNQVMFEAFEAVLGSDINCRIKQEF